MSEEEINVKVYSNDSFCKNPSQIIKKNTGSFDKTKLQPNYSHTSQKHNQQAISHCETSSIGSLRLLSDQLNDETTEKKASFHKCNRI